MRTLVPAETLVYLETNDLAAALQPIVDAKPFMEVAKSKPDFSALKGVQLAVAVTGFETSEEKLTDEHSVGRVQPRFVAVAETHAWNYQALKFAELKLGSFVANIYDSEPTLEKTDKHGGKYFTWTATDGRKAFALVIDSIIYFGNDESAIEKCLAVKRGETDSILKTGKIPVSDPATLASGYVSTDGIAQIAALVGLKFASEAGEDSEVQSAIAGILPQLIRNSITEVSWTSTKSEKGIEDKYTIGMPAEIGSLLNETMAPVEMIDGTVLSYLPNSMISPESFYNLKDPQVAWRSILLTAQKRTDPIAGKIIYEFSHLFFEPYGVRDPELFLSSVASPILTANFDHDGEKPVVIARVRDRVRLEKSLLTDLRRITKPNGFEPFTYLQSTEGDVSAAISNDLLVLGESNSVLACLNANRSQEINGSTSYFLSQRNGSIPIRTRGTESQLRNAIAEIMRVEMDNSAKESITIPIFETETRFTKTGIDRRTTSDFGLIGSIIAQLGGEE